MLITTVCKPVYEDNSHPSLEKIIEHIYQLQKRQKFRGGQNFIGTHRGWC